MNQSEEGISNALKECMEKELEAIPKDRDIKKQYTPSPRFVKYMNHLIRREKAKDKYKIVYEHRKGIYQFVAGAALIIISIQIGSSLISLNVTEEDLVNDNTSTESVLESTDTTETNPAAESAKSFMQETQETQETEETQETQEASETQADIGMKTQWGALVIGENEARLTLENTTNQSYTYSNILKVEKLENDTWVTIYSSELVEEKVLNPGASIEESINLSDYEITEVGSYKLYRDINNETVTVEMERMQ